jgi:glycoprotein 2-beta-D-xylosyltransferase
MTSYNASSNVETIKETTIAVSRRDYVNIYHTMTDLYTVYLLCRFFQRDPKSVRILFLDAHPKGNLDKFWSQLFHSFTRLGQLKNGSSLFYNELIWSQPQPQSEIDVQRHRRTPPSFFSEFRQHILQQFNINEEKNKTLNCGSLNIFFLVRHNYVAHPRNPSGSISRQLSNEKQILDDLKLKFSNKTNIKFSFNHFEELSIEEQLKIIVETDIFVGVHGAGLTHVLFLQLKRALIELAPNEVKERTHFESLSSINNINYRRCLITNGASTTTQTILDCINEKISEMCPPVTRLRITKQMVTTTSTSIESVSTNFMKI